ncbi:MAG: alpha-glucosidase, partial [Meiothermus sp.]|nr:alpha-glucosidase [Meiothermus sp.]
MNELLDWDIPFVRLEGLSLADVRAQAVEKEGVRAWRLLFTQRPRDRAKAGPAVQGARPLPMEEAQGVYRAEGLPPLALGEGRVRLGDLELTLWGLPHLEALPL